MKKRLTILLLCALLLGGTASAANPGGAGDPLISRSYIADAFLPQAEAALAAAADKAVAEQLAKTEHTPSAKILTLSAGQSVLLTAGQQFILLSGAAVAYTDAGELLNVTGGAAAGNGAVNARSRYLVCEDSRVYVDVAGDAVLKVSYAAETGAGSPFTDVTRGDWFYSDVVSAVERGLVNGMTPGSYAPAGTLTAAQCVKLAACMHQLYRDGAVTLENSPDGAPWYRSYVDYALEAGILEQEFYDYDAMIVRQRFVELFWRALPDSAYAPVNGIPDGAIPDVDMGDACGAEIYGFYRAGILTGYTADGMHAAHAFDADSLVTRAEAATIMNRMFDEDARIRFTMD